jgi:hypothetical protein
MVKTNKMKILLLGESSGFYTNLKDGLIELGHEVTLASFSDGYKKILSKDISFDSVLPGLLGKVENRIRPLLELRNLSGFDVVQLINPFEFDIPGFPATYFLKRIKNNNKKFFMSACGSDAYYYQKSSKILKYHPFDDMVRYDLKNASCKFMSKSSLEYNKNIANLVDGVIPIFYDCEVAYSGFSNLSSTIPIPLNANRVEYCENIVKEKLVIFHGLSRYGFKGTRYIEKAFEILNEKYPGKLELIIKGGLPLREYLKIQTSANIVVDQALSYSTGMNALYALAHGKVVLSGAEPESLTSLGVSSSPVVNILPEAEDIVSKIEQFIGDAALVKKVGAESRDFVVKYHNHVAIAEKYLKVWTSQ